MISGMNKFIQNIHEFGCHGVISFYFQGLDDKRSIPDFVFTTRGFAVPGFFFYEQKFFPGRKRKNQQYAATTLFRILA